MLKEFVPILSVVDFLIIVMVFTIVRQTQIIQVDLLRMW